MTQQTAPAQTKRDGPMSPAKRRQIYGLGLCAVLILILFIPAFSWIRAVHTEELYDVMGLKIQSSKS